MTQSATIESPTVRRVLKTGAFLLLLAVGASFARAQSSCPPTTLYGTGTAGTGGLAPALEALSVPVLGNAGFGFRATGAPANAPVGHLLGTTPTSQPILGFQLLVNAPLTRLAFADPTGTSAVVLGLPLDPLFAGLVIRSQAITLDPGAPQGIASTQGLAVPLCAASMTDVTVSNAVRVPAVKRLGLNLGTHDRWGAAKLLQNQLPNPGFEPGLFGTVWLADSSSTTDRFVVRDWTPGNAAHAPGFWNGAEFEIAHGPGAGTAGYVQAFTHQNGRLVFDLGNHGNVALQDRDVLFTRRRVAGTHGMNGGAGTPDPSNPHRGTQSLRLQPGENFGYVMDTSWRDGDRSSHKLLVVEGDWRIRLHARAANPGDEVRVRLRRDGSPPFNPTFLDRAFALGSAWTQYAETRTIAAGTDQTPDPWPVNTYRPALVFEVIVPSSNSGPVWIDDVELYRVDEATNPTVFTDRLVQRLADYRPGVLRWWGGQLGSTLENMTRSWPERLSTGFKPNGSSPGSWNYGAPDFLELCDHLDAEPWIVMPPTATAADLQGFVEYLAGTSGPMAARRQAQGRAAPWTTAFDRIHLEWSNEAWGSGAPGDPFAGSSVNGGVRLGRLADRAFEFVKASPWYAPNAARFDLVIGGQAGYSGRQAEIEANADDHDSTALAPYFGRLDTFGNAAEIYGPLFANPLYESLAPGGRMRQSWQHLQNASQGTELSIYEVNYHTTGIIPGLSATLRNDFVAGSSGALALPLTMLVHLTELGARNQCAFSALQYSYRFDTSGGWPPQQHQFVQVWGMLRDLYHFDVRRPTWVGVEVCNRAIFGDAITTTHGGDDPEWTQTPMNGIGTPTTVGYIQSFAFRDGSDYGIVLFNLSLDEHHGVRLVVPGSPQPNATMHRLEPADLALRNDRTELVAPTTEPITDFGTGYEMLLPPHSVRVVTWNQ